MKVHNTVQYLVFLILIVSCQQEIDPAPTIPAPPTAAIKTVMPQIFANTPTAGPLHRPQPGLPTYGYTNQRADGNRFSSGMGRLPEAEHVDIPLEGVPLWLVAAPLIGETSSDSASIWAAVLDDGRAQAFLVEDGEVTELTGSAGLSGPIPPILRISQGQPELLVSLVLFIPNFPYSCQVKSCWMAKKPFFRIIKNA